MNACVIFDVSARPIDVKIALRASGYFSSWSSSSVSTTVYQLPTNAMWKPNCELAQARNEIQNIINTLNAQNPNPIIVLQRCIVLSVNPWDGIAGMPG